MSQLNIPGRGYALDLKVTDFHVWEHPLNHINLKAAVECKVIVLGTAGAPAYVYLAQCQATNQSIGTVFSTSRTFIRNMNKISNKFAADLSIDVLKGLQKEIREQNLSATKQGSRLPSVSKGR